MSYDRLTNTMSFDKAKVKYYASFQVKFELEDFEGAIKTINWSITVSQPVSNVVITVKL